MSCPAHIRPIFGGYYCDPSRQRPMPLLGPPHLADHLIIQPGRNTLVRTPTDTRSDNRRSDSGFLQPARRIIHNYATVGI